MECTFEQFIEEIRKVLRETDQLSKDVEELLRSYGGIQILKIVFKDSSDEGRKNAQELKVVCEEIVNSTYIATKIKAVFLSFTIKKTEPHRVNIPERLRPKAEEIEEYDARIRRELDKADTLLQKIERKLTQIAGDETFTLTEGVIIQIKMMHIDFKKSLKKASDDHQKAEQALASLKDDVKSYLLEKFGISVLATAVGAAVGYDAVAAAGRAVKYKEAAYAAAGGLAVSVVLYQLYYIYDDYNKCMNRCKKLESMLNLLKSSIYKREVDKEAVEEKMELFKNS